MATGDVKPAALDERLKLLAPGNDGPPDSPAGTGLPSFGFAFKGLPFQAEVVPGAAPVVRLTAELGLLPYTVESPRQRHWALRIVAASRSLERGGLAVGADGMLRLSAQAALPADGGPVGVLAAVTALLLDFKPHLEALAEATAAFPALRSRLA